MDYGAIELTKISLEGKPKKKQKPFRKTDRYVRGKIIDMVRVGPVDENELIHDIAETCDRDIFVVREIIRMLADEGLLQYKNGSYQLPE